MAAQFLSGHFLCLFEFVLFPARAAINLDDVLIRESCGCCPAVRIGRPSYNSDLPIRIWRDAWSDVQENNVTNVVQSHQTSSLSSCSASRWMRPRLCSSSWIKRTSQRILVFYIQKHIIGLISDPKSSNKALLDITFKANNLVATPPQTAPSKCENYLPLNRCKARQKH